MNKKGDASDFSIEIKENYVDECQEENIRLYRRTNLLGKGGFAKCYKL